MAAPGNQLLGEIRRPRTRLHLDIVPEHPDDSDDFEAHIDFIGSSRVFAELMGNVIRGGVRGLMPNAQNNDDYGTFATLERLVRLGIIPGQAGVVRDVGAAVGPVTNVRTGGAEAPNEVRFRQHGDGIVTCSRCGVDVPEAEAAAHARGHGAGQVREEVTMRPVAPDGPQGQGGEVAAPEGATPGAGVSTDEGVTAALPAAPEGPAP